MLYAPAFVEVSAANQFAFFGFGKEHVLCECLGFDFGDALFDFGIAVHPELQTNDTLRVLEQMADGVEKSPKVFGVIHFRGRELDDGA